MPFFSPKTWKQRIVEFPGRRRLDDTSSADVYDVSRAEGTVTQEGDGFTAANMNDLEQRIYSAVNEIVEIEKVVNGNQADLYSPDETYTAGRLVINNNALWKAKQDIDVAEPWTPAHWDQTTVAAELSAVNSRFQNIVKAEIEEYQEVTTGVALTAKNIDGYRFVAWVSADVIGTTTFSIIGSAISQSTQFYFGVNTPVTVRVCALYVKS